MRPSSQYRSRIRSATASGWLGSLLASVIIICGARAADAPSFTSPVDDSPLELKLLPEEKLTEGVQNFYRTGENPYKSDPQALAQGKDIYQTICQVCHMPNGGGRVGPSLIGDTHRYSRFTTDKGMFEIVYGGATGAMQAFGKRLTQDQILCVTAYVRSLKK